MRVFGPQHLKLIHSFPIIHIWPSAHTHTCLHTQIHTQKHILIEKYLTLLPQRQSDIFSLLYNFINTNARHDLPNSLQDQVTGRKNTD